MLTFHPLQGKVGGAGCVHPILRGQDLVQPVLDEGPLLGQELASLLRRQVGQEGDADVVRALAGIVAGQVAAQELPVADLPRGGDGVDLAGGPVARLFRVGLHQPLRGHPLQGVVGGGGLQAGHEVQVLLQELVELVAVHGLDAQQAQEQELSILQVHG